MRTIAALMLAAWTTLSPVGTPAFSESTVEIGVPITEVILLAQMEDLLREQVSIMSEDTTFFSDIFDWRTPFCRSKHDRITKLREKRLDLERDLQTASMRLESWQRIFSLRRTYGLNEVRLSIMYELGCNLGA